MCMFGYLFYPHLGQNIIISDDFFVSPLKRNEKQQSPYFDSFHWHIHLSGFETTRLTATTTKPSNMILRQDSEYMSANGLTI